MQIRDEGTYLCFSVGLKRSQNPRSRGDPKNWMPKSTLPDWLWPTKKKECDHKVCHSWVQNHPSLGLKHETTIIRSMENPLEHSRTVKQFPEGIIEGKWFPIPVGSFWNHGNEPPIKNAVWKTPWQLRKSRKSSFGAWEIPINFRFKLRHSKKLRL